MYSLFSAFSAWAIVSLLPWANIFNQREVGVLIGSCTSLLFIAISSRKGIFPLQREVLRVVYPDTLLNALTPLKLKRQQELQSLKAFQSLEKQYPYGVRIALLELMAREYNYKPKSAGLAIGLVIAGYLLSQTFEAMYEAFIQDTLYDPYIKPLLQKINILN